MVDLLSEQTLGESWKLDHMINFMVALRLGCKVNCAGLDFDLNEKNVGHNLPHKVSVISVEMEVLNGCYIVVSCLGLRHDGSVWGQSQQHCTTSTHSLFTIFIRG